MVKKGDFRMTNEEYIKSLNTRRFANFLQRFDCFLCSAKTYSCISHDRYVCSQEKIEKWLKKEIEE